MSSSLKKVRGIIAAVVAVVFCPCHLALTLPLALTLLGGSAGGMFLTSHSELLFVSFGVLFIGALVVVYRSFGSQGREARGGGSCTVPSADVDNGRESVTVATQEVRSTR